MCNDEKSHRAGHSHRIEIRRHGGIQTLSPKYTPQPIECVARHSQTTCGEMVCFPRFGGGTRSSLFPIYTLQARRNLSKFIDEDCPDSSNMYVSL